MLERGREVDAASEIAQQVHHGDTAGLVDQSPRRERAGRVGEVRLIAAARAVEQTVVGRASTWRAQDSNGAVEPPGKYKNDQNRQRASGSEQHS